MDDDPRLRDHQPGLRWTVIVSIVGLLVILALNNPTEADARKFVGERLSAAMRGSVTGGSPEERAGAGLAMAILAPMVDSALVVERRDLIIASHYTVKPNAFLEALQTASGKQDTLGEICLIGIFGKFLPCGAKGQVASQLMDGKFEMPGAPAAPSEPTVPAPVAEAPPDPDEAAAPAAPAESAPTVGYADVSDVLLAIGVRIRAGELDEAEHRIAEVETLSLSPEDQVVLESLKRRVEDGRRNAAAPGRSTASASTTPARPVAKVDFQRSPSLDPYYPLSARRAEQQGVATLRSCVDAAGRLSGEPAVIESSGHRSLDDGAVSWARAARYSPAVESGRRIDSCATFRVRFVLQE